MDNSKCFLQPTRPGNVLCALTLIEFFSAESKVISRARQNTMSFTGIGIKYNCFFNE
jgi:hypothetical protein